MKVRQAATTESNPRVVFALADLPFTGTARVPVIVTGSWEKTTEDGTRQIVVTLAQLNSIVKNFARKVNGEINVDYDHKSQPVKRDKIAEPIPSAGRIVALAEPGPYTDLQGVERHIVWGTYEPTERARELVRKREYRWMSAAWYSSGDDAQLSTIALTNTPLMEEMPQVQLSEAGFREVRSPESGQKINTAAKAAKNQKHWLWKNLTLQNVAPGEYAVMDGDTSMGTIDHNHLKSYAAKNCAEDIGQAMAVECATGPNGAGPCEMAMAEAIKKRMMGKKETFEVAEFNLVGTPGGLKIYEAARKERLAKAPKA